MRNKKLQQSYLESSPQAKSCLATSSTFLPTNQQDLPQFSLPLSKKFPHPAHFSTAPYISSFLCFNSLHKSCFSSHPFLVFSTCPYSVSALSDFLLPQLTPNSLFLVFSTCPCSISTFLYFLLPQLTPNDLFSIFSTCSCSVYTLLDFLLPQLTPNDL